MTAAKQAMQANKASSDYVTPTKARDAPWSHDIKQSSSALKLRIFVHVKTS